MKGYYHTNKVLNPPLVANCNLTSTMQESLAFIAISKDNLINYFMQHKHVFFALKHTYKSFIFLMTVVFGLAFVHLN